MRRSRWRSRRAAAAVLRETRLLGDAPDNGPMNGPRERDDDETPRV
jgi:hypothetical protein